MFLKRFALAFLALVFLSIFGPCTLCLAQLNTATILGTVFDSSGAVIPGAAVVVQNMGTSASVNLITGPNGSFIAPVLPTGNYKITVSMSGFNTYVRESVRLSVDDRIQLSITLKAGGIAQEVTVVAEAPLVSTASTTLGTVISSQQVADLPLVGRSITSLAGLVPGANPAAMNGAAAGKLFDIGQKFLVDGGDSSQVDSDLALGGYASGVRISRLSVDALDEFRLVTQNYSAEYGSSLSGVVNFISKSGTNQFHGSLFEFFRNEKLDARNYFNPPPLYKPAYRLNQFGGSLGGRIVPNKLFFFVNYEGIRQRSGVSRSVYVPTAAFRASLPAVLQPVVAQLPLPNGAVSATEPRLALFNVGQSNELTEDTGMWKIDYQATAKDRFSVRHNTDVSFTKTYYGIAEGQWRDIPNKQQTAKISYTRTIAPNMLNEAGVFINRLRVDTAAAGSEAVRKFPQTTLGGGSSGVGPSWYDMRVGNTSYTYADTLSWVRGRHQLKFGTQVSRYQDNKEVIFQQGVVFLSLNAFSQNKPYYVQTIGWPMQGMRNTQYGFFVQDDFQVNHNLTLTAGLRYQYDSAPSEDHGRIANFDYATGKVDARGTQMLQAPKTNFGPRLGLAYTPFSSRKTVLRAGFGIFHSSLNPAIAQWLPSNLLAITQSALVTVLDDPTLIGFPTPKITALPGTQSLQAMNKDWRATYSEAWNLNVQQELSRNMVLQVGYVGNRTLHLNLTQETNPVIYPTGKRRYPGFSNITLYTAAGNANYNSLQVTTKHRFAHGLAFNANYTYAHSLDMGAGGSQNPNDLRADYGSADSDIRHYLEFDYIYQLPKLPSLLRYFGSGWQINGITTMQSGYPVNITCGCDSGGIGAATGRPNLVPGVSSSPAVYMLPTSQINRAAFSTPVAGTFGNVGRNTLRGPSAYSWDFSVFNKFRVHEGQRIEFRAELFNIFNTPRFGNPGGSIASTSTFGQSRVSASGRQMQFGLKFVF